MVPFWWSLIFDNDSIKAQTEVAPLSFWRQYLYAIYVQLFYQGIVLQDYIDTLYYASMTLSMYSINAILFPLYLYWRKDMQYQYELTDMDALILSTKPMTARDTTFAYYYKMNPTRRWGIYFDFIVQFVQSLVLVIWILNLILIPIQWSL